jgi:predicted transcriptional regulator
MAPPVSVSSITRMSSTLKDLFVYVYDLSVLDMDTLINLIKNNGNNNKNGGHDSAMTLEEIAKQLKRDKANVFKSLQRLVNLGICNKEAKTQKSGGICHVYSAINKQVFKMETEKRVKELEGSFQRILGQFEEDMDNMVKTFYQG